MDENNKTEPTEEQKAAEVKSEAAAADSNPNPAATEHVSADPAEGVRVNDPTAPEAIAQQHRDRDAALEKLNEENMPGHEKNMAAIQASAEEAQARTAHADDPRANFTPTGKEDNKNTPRVLDDGTKVW